MSEDPRIALVKRVFEGWSSGSVAQSLQAPAAPGDEGMPRTS